MRPAAATAPLITSARTMALVPAMPVVRRRVRMLPLLLPPECRLAGNEDAGSSPRRVSSRSPARATRTMVPTPRRDRPRAWAVLGGWSSTGVVQGGVSRHRVPSVQRRRPSGRRGDPHGSDAASASMPSSADVASAAAPRPRGTSRDRTRSAPGARRRAAGAGADRRRARAPARAWRSVARRRRGPAMRGTASSSSSTAVSAIASRRSARTRSIVVRSMPLSRSSSRIARSPRGRARSRDSTQARANASSSSMPELDRAARSRPRPASGDSRPSSAGGGPRHRPRPRPRGSAPPPRARPAGSSTAARRRSRRSANDSRRRRTARRRPLGATRPLRCPRPGSSTSLILAADRGSRSRRRSAGLALRKSLDASRPWPRRVSPKLNHAPVLRDDVHRDADVEQAALLGDALAVHDVELGDAERRRDLVLHDLDAHPVADRLGAGLDRLDRAGCPAAPRRRTSARGRPASSPGCRT